MKRLTVILFNCLIVQLLFTLTLIAQNKIVVDLNGQGNFKSIQEAINSLPDSSLTVNTIFIKNETSKEKIFIVKRNIVFEGENNIAITWLFKNGIS